MHRFVKQGIKSARNMVIAEPKPNPFSNKLLVLSHNYSLCLRDYPPIPTFSSHLKIPDISQSTTKKRNKILAY